MRRGHPLGFLWIYNRPVIKSQAFHLSRLGREEPDISGIHVKLGVEDDPPGPRVHCHAIAAELIES